MKRSKLGFILLLVPMLTAGACEKIPSSENTTQPSGQAAAPQSASDEGKLEQGNDDAGVEAARTSIEEARTLEEDPMLTDPADHMEKQVRGEELTTMFKPAPITEQEALEIAQKYEASAGLNWTVEYEANYELVLGHEKQIFNAWIVTGTFPLGNKLVVYIDADTGKFIAASEIEAGSL
jgi:hypothetical protein